MDKKKDFVKKIHAEKKKIEIDKWNEGIKIHHDPGPEFTPKWIDEHGAEFHQKWLKCKCRTCTKSDECGHKELMECNEYNEEK